jgi:alkanesulfonate monooxygenase SsuD/methylene tetrahydromethanopterin reductase-like flavin-dependent oxidoreductase (luciferase family)
VIAADSEHDARVLATSLQQAFVNLRRGRPGPLPPPDADFPQRMSPQEHAMLNEALACSFVGTPATIGKGVRDFIARTGADELMIASQVFDHAARLRCFEIAQTELSAQAG